MFMVDLGSSLLVLMFMVDLDFFLFLLVLTVDFRASNILGVLNLRLLEVSVD
jgi:hypothetical protein